MPKDNSNAENVHLLINRGRLTACHLPFEWEWLETGECTFLPANCTCPKCKLYMISEDKLKKLYKMLTTGLD